MGWSHHRWLCDVADGEITFVGKPGFMHARPELHFPRDAYDALTPEERVQQLWWNGPFPVRERIFMVPEELEAYLAAIVPAAGASGLRSLYRRLRGTQVR